LKNCFYGRAIVAGERGFEPQIMFKGSPLFGEEPEPIVIGSA